MALSYDQDEDVGSKALYYLNDMSTLLKLFLCMKTHKQTQSHTHQKRHNLFL